MKGKSEPTSEPVLAFSRDTGPGPALPTAAIDTLERNLNCENPAVEIRSASIVLEQSIKGLEILDVEGRLVMLESLVKHTEEQNV